MYSLSKSKNTYKITNKKRKTKGWIIHSKSYTDLEKIAENLKNDVPKIYLKRICLNTTSTTNSTSLSSLENSNEGNNNDTTVILDEFINVLTDKNCVDQQDLIINSSNEILETSFNTLMAEINDKDDIIFNLSENINPNVSLDVSAVELVAQGNAKYLLY